MILNNKQKQYLKGLAHSQAGRPAGTTRSDRRVLAEIDLALNHHELIKVKVASEDREDETAGDGCHRSRDRRHQVQSMGHVLTIYRQAKEPKIQLPRK